MFTFLSPAWTQLLGYKISEGLGQQHTIFIHPDDIPMCEQAFDEVVMNGDSFSRIEYRIKHKKGHWRWHALSGSLVKDEDGDPLFFVGIAQDITDAKRAVEELKESEERLRLLFESMVQGIVLQGGDGEEIFSNKAVENILGMQHVEFIKLILSNSHLVVDENGLPFGYQDYPSNIALKHGVVVNDVTVGLLDKIGNRYRWVLISAIPQFQKESTKPYRVFTTFIDVTERKYAEKTVQGYLHNLNAMDKINQIGLKSTTI
jgi:PAS domain S-box-containing protein